MLLLSVATVLVVLTSSTAVQAQGLEAGVGYADITGPAGEVPMMGYAEASQKTAGIHMRLFARAFAFRDAEGRSAAFVNVDAGMISPMMKLKVIEILKSKLGSTYTEANVLLSATHTHSGPGGYHGYTLYAISTLGYFADTFNTLANGIARSIELAHASLRPTKLQFNSGQLANSGVNRSPTSYLLNPESERARYEHNTDRDMTVVKLVDANSGKPFGMLNWFAVHPTSMNNTNLLISGDNKGWAAQAFERFMDYQAGTNTLPGGQRFVASFANANEGDVSPNTDGPRCMDTGEPCDIATSTCGGKAKHCVASGPGKDMLDSTRIIGLKQFGRAMELFDSAKEELAVDSVSYSHQYVDMSNQQLTVNGRRVRTCPPAMGFSFAAGTTDGPGGFDFTQGDTSGNPFWNLVRGILSKPNEEQINCHSPKPILLNTGYMTFPTDWQPKVIETQLLKIGPLVIVALPGEFTTMSGRRVREAVQKALADNGMTGAKVVLSGVSNLYSSYVTTFEEYQAQRYEAASTIFGPHTLSAYVQQFGKLAAALATNTAVQSEIHPPNNLGSIKGWSFVSPIVYDSVGINRNFGDVVQQPASSYSAGQTVSAKFRTGHPRNNMMLGGTFLLVQKKTENGGWVDVCNDACVETRFSWIRTNGVLGRSEAHIEWDIPVCAQPGIYRLKHFGWYKPVLIWESPKSFSGTTNEFTVKNSSLRRFLRRTGYTIDVINGKIGGGCLL
ncbi:hypothetical protein BOX15_Mlig016966g2 [Macrostomum lignano]|uniref:Neutral ceramidase n=1 Tax=Macrostomum lignano TaxID=282301 RepID=A0A267GF32_9PLAT|nr:hypothetical protein BOX15_Mlig016966g2 [Macrostomum lignano]